MDGLLLASLGVLFLVFSIIVGFLLKFSFGKNRENNVFINSFINGEENKQEGIKF